MLHRFARKQRVSVIVRWGLERSRKTLHSSDMKIPCPCTSLLKYHPPDPGLRRVDSEVLHGDGHGAGAHCIRSPLPLTLPMLSTSFLHKSSSHVVFLGDVHPQTLYKRISAESRDMLRTDAGLHTGKGFFWPY